MDNFEQWASHFNTVVAPSMRLVHSYSPEWLRIFQDTFEMYDKLESTRRKSSEPRRHWQDLAEQSRETLEEGYKARDELPPPGASVLYPLSTHLAGYLEDDIQDRSCQWRSTLETWNLFQLLYGEQDDEATHDFRSSLSYTQRISYEILNDWWQVLYCDQELIESIKRFLNERLDDTSLPVNFEKLDPGETSINKSLYHASCWTLFYHEFNPYAWNPYTWRSAMTSLTNCRDIASTHATLQRFAVSFMPGFLNQPSSRLEWMPYTDVLSGQTGWHKPTEHVHLPKYLWDTVTKQTVLVSTFMNTPRYTCISHTWGRWREHGVSVAIAGVPWQVPANTLYDVSKLPDILVAVSVRYVWLDLFCIPQDGSIVADIEIGRQASIFGRAHDCIAWLHDVESWQGTQKALRWIAIRYLQNTTVFAHSREAQITNDVRAAWSEANVVQSDLAFESWEKIAAWHQILHTFDLSSPWQTNNELSNIAASSVSESATWFSSLWTLQEAILSPNLRLCSRSFEPLTDSMGQALPLNILTHVLQLGSIYASFEKPPDVDFSNVGSYQMTLAHRYRNANLGAWPRSSRSLLKLDELNWALRSLLPVDVLVTAGRRQCTGNRAEAIMSAVGATQWYEERIAAKKNHGLPSSISLALRSQPLNDLILGTYPLAFIQEVARKTGAAFYKTLSSGIKIRLPLSVPWSEDQGFASMMPFGEGGRGGDISMFSAEPFPNAHIGHASVNGWSFSQTGFVRMSEASIAASSHKHSLGKGQSARITLQTPWYGEGFQSTHVSPVLVYETDNLQGELAKVAIQELEAFRKTGSDAATPRIYAVSLFQSPIDQHGIILLSTDRRKYPRSLGGKRYLIKIGVYTCLERQMPPGRRVNWVVL